MSSQHRQGAEPEVAVIGAGPLGIEMAVALKEQGIPYIHFEKGQVGQAIFNFPVSTHFFSSSERIGLAGVPIQTVGQQKCTREEYLAYLRSFVMQFGLQIKTNVDVVSIQKLTDAFLLKTRSNGQESNCRVKYLIVATGGTSKPNRLGVTGEDLPHVSDKLLDPHIYFNKRVAIIGGKNSAAEAALRCFNAGAHVTMIVRGEAFQPDVIKYWILPELLSRIQNGHITCYYASQVAEIRPDHLVLAGSLQSIATDYVIKAIGFEADMSLFRQAGVSLSSHGTPTFNPATMETDVENLWVLGTASAGTQRRYRVFIENCHEHVPKIVRSLCEKMGRVCRPFSFRFDAKPPLANPNNLEQ